MTKKTPWLLYIFLALGVYLFIFAYLIPHTSVGNSICGSCHETSAVYQSWSSSSHYRTNCTDCHNEPGLGGFIYNQARALKSLKVKFLGQERNFRLSVTNDACLNCHDRIIYDLVVKRGVKMSHKEVIKSGWLCSQCHGSTAHKLPASKSRISWASEDKCWSCHLKRPTLRRCQVCHLKVSKKMPTSIRKFGSLAHLTDWDEAHGAASSRVCANCHQGNFCQKCHGVSLPHTSAWPRQHGKVSGNYGELCFRCHKQEFCQDCHRLPMPHPKPYWPRHGLEAKLNQESTCYRCHQEFMCTNCHSNHKRQSGAL